ncbi:glycosyltransferase family 4 protein [Algiphilus sp.]|uniref:glycosyltransferase family 4 protein n=1 Tax=Algiphilus sp. TaxID=1872431 RepID=UPI003B52E79E
MKDDAEKKVYIWGAFPPPVTGKTAITAAVSKSLCERGVPLVLFDVASSGLSRSVWVRLLKLPRVLGALIKFFITPIKRGSAAYVSISGGWAQVYEAAFSVIGRLKGCKMVVHHHSFAYLDHYSWRTRLLTVACGRECIHITQSSGMAEKLQSQYLVADARGLSNATFLMDPAKAVDLYSKNELTRSKVREIGFISNICLEKGIMEFLDLVAAAGKAGLSLHARLAGPFQDAATEQAVRARLASLPQVEYVGPQYNAAKDAFFAGIDVLVFPTRYKNETEGMVIHEAMSRGVPVIAYGRGCIPEIVGANCGLVIDPSAPFVPAALARLQSWLADSAAFEASSLAAAAQFTRTYEQGEARWQALLADLVGGSAVRGPAPATSGGTR